MPFQAPRRLALRIAPERFAYPVGMSSTRTDTSLMSDGR